MLRLHIIRFLSLLLYLAFFIACTENKNNTGKNSENSNETETEKIQVEYQRNLLKVGRFSISFQRTLRIPDDNKSYPLPPGLGTFPIKKVEDYKDKVPKQWLEYGGYFIPMYQREAMWLSFSAAYWKPNAIKVGIGAIDAISGNSLDTKLKTEPQNYLVCPTQPWLDGINAGDGYIKQFVAMPLGKGYTVEGQITGKETFGGLQIIVFEPKKGRFPDTAPKNERAEEDSYEEEATTADAEESGVMGLGAGGKIIS